MNKKISFILISAAFSLGGCSSDSSISSILDRSPDYKTSSVSRKIEVPPDLSDAALDTSLAVSDFSPSSVSSYNDYYGARVKRNSRGYIEVLPQLYKTKVNEQQGQLPYISTEANPTVAWQLVKKYWQSNGVKLSTESAQIGIMETDWLENAGARPQTGLNGLISSLLGFLTDSDTRDRYRLRFSHNNNGGTDIAIIYTKSELKPEYDHPTSKHPAGFRWDLSDTEKPEYQLEMTRRIALYISGELEKNPALLEINPSDTSSSARPATKAVGQSRLTNLSNGTPALEITGDYAQSWRVLGIALDRASFEILSSDYDRGTYQVKYRPETDKKKKGLFSLFGKDKEERPVYLVRISDQSDKTLTIIQRADGSPASKEEARELLEMLNF